MTIDHRSVYQTTTKTAEEIRNSYEKQQERSRIAYERKLEEKRQKRLASLIRRKVKKQTLKQKLSETEKQLRELRNKVEVTKSKFPEPPTYTPGMGKDFYLTREWRNLRWSVVSKSNGKCAVCGRTHKEHGIVIHVDHIKPRSKYPELELEPKNMQLLCADCNLGKGAKPQF